MVKLIYRRGQERDIVCEEANFSDSIFNAQYFQALKLVDSYLLRPEDKSLKSLAFCGGRGDGKTSCMATVLRLIEKPDEEATLYLQKIGCQNILDKKIERLDIIDPAFFDENHNVLEIVISHLYNSFSNARDQKNRCGCNIDGEQCYNVTESFNAVKESLRGLNGKTLPSLDALHELKMLAVKVDLQKQMAHLVEEYLKFVGKDCLVIPIDDIDLSFVHAYDMCEQIRKYLAIPKCIVSISVKVDQLESVIATKFRDSVKNDELVTSSEISEMATKYLNKLLPVSNRIMMLRPFELADVEVEIRDERNNIELSDRLKMMLVRTIFQNTRYLFYNPVSGSIPILPPNIRDLMNMVGLLSSMDTPPSDETLPEFKETLNRNKRRFKSYFYSVWVNQFSKEIRTELEKLVNYDLGTSFNKEVISFIIRCFGFIEYKDYDTTLPNTESEKTTENSQTNEKSDKPVLSEEIISSITYTLNFSYNISIGDVFYIISLLESETLSEHDYALLFFLKSLYSIKMYEAYDETTEINGNIYPTEKDETKGLMTTDHRFDHINTLQQLTCGSYFTYRPGELIVRKSRSESFDLRAIRTQPLYQLLRDVISDSEDFFKNDYHGDPESLKKREEFNLKLNICEFFIMTSLCSIFRDKEDLSTPDEIIKQLKVARKNIEPFHFKEFNTSTGYLLFDVMAPFANVLNPKFAYTRFPQINEEIYKSIFDYENSLLHKMVDSVRKERTHINHNEHDDWTKIHRLLSDGAIRNSEVLMAIKNNIIHKRLTNRDSGWEGFIKFYSHIQSSGMKTHNRTKAGASSRDAYEIKFAFLKPLNDLLTRCAKEGSTANKIFNEIFDSIQSSKNTVEPTESFTFEGHKFTIQTIKELFKGKSNANSRAVYTILKALAKNDLWKRHIDKLNHLFKENKYYSYDEIFKILKDYSENNDNKYNNQQDNSRNIGDIPFTPSILLSPYSFFPHTSPWNIFKSENSEHQIPHRISEDNNSGTKD